MTDSLSQTQYLTFYIGSEEYGVPILRVREIIAYGVVTRVPGAPLSVRGVINLRGAVVPVIDLAMKFRQTESVVTRRTCIVILDVVVNGEATTAGLLADAVSHVVDLPPGMIEPPPAFGTTVRLEYLQGMGRSDSGFVLILAVDKLLLEEEIDGAVLGGEMAVAAAGADPGHD